jgi:transposase InsO family protein
VAEPSQEALFRYQVVSQVLSRELSGEPRARAVVAVAGMRHRFFDGRVRRVSVRTLYRWLRSHESEGLPALENSRRERTSDSSVLPVRFVEFLRTTKEQDPRVSIPELIRRARELGLVDPHTSLDRSTVYRTAVRLALPVGHIAKQPERDTRRYAYPHRMDMALADGKHFRAGAARARRVALAFLDDASRWVPRLVVGTSENTVLFLRGLYETIRKCGLMGIMYIDQGPGFIAESTVRVLANLGVLLIHGEAAYPEGHGKIERWNRTLFNDLLRGLDGRPDVDPDCGALELRLNHYVHEIYNQRPHESLGGESPAQRFHADPKPLRFPENDAELRAKFEIHLARRVSADHVVQVDGVLYEMPRGYAGQRVVLRERLLDGTLAFLHQGRLMELHPVDLAANARARRARQDAEEDVQHPLPKSAADLAFERDFGPVLDADGGFPEPPQESEP